MTTFFQEARPDRTCRDRGRPARWARLLLAALAVALALAAVEVLTPDRQPACLRLAVDGPVITETDFEATVTASALGGLPALVIVTTDLGGGVEDTHVLDLVHPAILIPNSRLDRLPPAMGGGSSPVRRVSFRRFAGRLHVTVDDRPVWNHPQSTGTIQLRTYGASLDSFRVQRLAPFTFADDFGRISMGRGDGWEIQSGTWRIACDSEREAAPNQFIGTGTGAPGKPAVMTAGHPFWCGYRYEASVRLDRAAAVSLLVGWQEPGHFTEIRLSRLGMQALARHPDTATPGDTVLGTWPVGLLPDTWYRVRIDLADDHNFTCAIDGSPPFAVRSARRLAGRIGVAVEDGTAQIDDLQVDFPRPAGEPPPVPLRAVSHPYSRKARYPKDDRDDHLDRWAKDADAWEELTVVAPNDTIRAWRFHLPFFSDFDVALDDQPGTVFLTDLKNRLLARYNLIPHDTVSRQEGRIAVSTPGAAPVELAGPCHVWFKPVTARTPFAGPQLTAAGVRQEFFEQAPANWLTHSGTWQMTNRWQCEPRWAFYGGFGPDSVVQYGKLRFDGNQRHEVYFGMKDLFRREFERRRYARHDVNLSFMTNGRDLFSGYTLMFGGFDNEFTCLMRRDHVVATNAANKFPPFVDIDDLHLFWRRLRVECIDHRVRAWLDDNLLVEYTDPYPETAPRGGHLALWTYRNGIVYARLNSTAEQATPSAIALAEQPPAIFPANGWAPLDPGRVSVDAEGWVTNRFGGGEFAVACQLPQPIDLDERPVLRLPLDIPEAARVSLHLVVNGQGLIVPLTAPAEETWRILGSAGPWNRRPDWAIYADPPLGPPLVEGQPRAAVRETLVLNLREELRRRFPDLSAPKLTSLVVGNTSLHHYLAAGLDGNIAGTRYRVGTAEFLPAGAL